jgi:hypothetical protein
MTLKITQQASAFWLQKLEEQIATVHKRRQNEALERILAPDIALAYLFLYLYLEAAIDKIVLDILTHTEGVTAHPRYRKPGRRFYLRDKLEFAFAEFCSQLSFQEFAHLKKSVDPIIRIRNRIVHLEELSWSVSWPENQKPKEKPTDSTEHLTLQRLKRHYGEVRDFLAGLETTLNRGFGNRKIDVEHREGNRRETKAHNLIEFVYGTLPSLKEFDEIV